METRLCQSTADIPTKANLSLNIMAKQYNVFAFMLCNVLTVRYDSQYFRTVLSNSERVCDTLLWH
jgi:hypothetical protein